jgi:hypothetical protein
MTSADLTLRAFIGALFPVDEHHLELRLLPSEHRCFFSLGGDLDGLHDFIDAAARAQQHVYFGVATRVTTANGRRENCGFIGALFTDIDFKVTPEADARERLARFPLAPSIVVHTGGGLHVYWLLREPLDIHETDPDPLLRCLSRALRGDLKAGEAARVLRVPGTWNVKPEYGAPRPVRLELLDESRRYNPSDFDFLPPEPATNGQHGPGVKVAATIPDGLRNATLYQLGRSLHARQLSEVEILATLRATNQTRCVPPLEDGELQAIAREAATQTDRADFRPTAAVEAPAVDVVDWPLHDAADPWTFAPVAFTVDTLLPASGVVWWGGPPKRFKSLLAAYMCLAIASGRDSVAEHFTIRQRPRILYVAREDGGSRLQARRDDILSVWSQRPIPRGLRFVIRPRLDLLNATHVAWLRETCRREGVTLLVLDTWTTLSPTADPMSAVDQTRLAAVVVDLAEAIGGTVVVVDHSRKNRADDQPISSADIYGPLQKWATAEHICMFDLTTDRRRLELFVEGKDGDTRRLFLAITPKGGPGEKFTYAGTVEDIADAQRAKGDQNRDAIHRVLIDAGAGLTPKEVHAGTKARGLTLGEETVSKHLRALAKVGRADVIGKGPSTRYVGIAPAPSDAITVRDSELFDGARS